MFRRRCQHVLTFSRSGVPVRQVLSGLTDRQAQARAREQAADLLSGQVTVTWECPLYDCQPQGCRKLRGPA